MAILARPNVLTAPLCARPPLSIDKDVMAEASEKGIE